MRFIRAGVTSNEAPAAETAEPPVHFYQAHYAHYIHTSGNVSTCSEAGWDPMSFSTLLICRPNG